jgi:hypothetical protein
MILEEGEKEKLIGQKIAEVFTSIGFTKTYWTVTRTLDSWDVAIVLSINFLIQN